MVNSDIIFIYTLGQEGVVSDTSTWPFTRGKLHRPSIQCKVTLNANYVNA